MSVYLCTRDDSSNEHEVRRAAFKTEGEALAQAKHDLESKQSTPLRIEDDEGKTLFTQKQIKAAK